MGLRLDESVGKSKHSRATGNMGNTFSHLPHVVGCTVRLSESVTADGGAGYRTKIGLLHRSSVRRTFKSLKKWASTLDGH